jgi:hypothetical protein
MPNDLAGKQKVEDKNGGLRQFFKDFSTIPCEDAPLTKCRLLAILEA